VRLGEAYVSDGHFGGGFLKKTEDSEETRNNRESLIDNLIADSKKRKEERQKEKEETDDLTDKLDQDYKDLLDILVPLKNPSKAEAVPVKLPDSGYDILVRELRFDPRGKPSDKLKSAEEVARINKEKLEKLETDRLNRMRGEADPSKKINHRSADDLDDGFNYYQAPKVEKTLSFDIKEASEMDNQIDDVKEESDHEEESGESDDDDSFSDLASSQESDNDEVVVKEKKVKKKSATNQTARNDKIPFVFKVPEEYDEFHQLLQSFKDQDQRTVLERMIKSNHPALNGTNKVKLEKVFAFLMQYIHDLSGTGSSLQLLNDLAPVAYDLAQIIPSSNVASTMLDVLLEKREELPNLKKQQPVSVATLVFLKLTALIFPTSDFRHPVTTPAYHVLIESLHRPVINLPIVQIGLGLSTVAYEFVSLCKRFIPEVIHYLHGVVELAIPRPTTVAAHHLVFPFRPVGIESQLLVLTGENTESLSPEKLKLSEMDYNDQFRVSALHVTVQLISNFLDLWHELPAAIDVFDPILKSLTKLPVEIYHSQVKESVEALVLGLSELKAKTRKRLIHEAKKPRPLRLYEPVIEEYFDGQKKRVGSKEKQERDKLQHKLKREMKGAIREIRKDNAFLGRQKIKEQIERDGERKRKAKEILSSLAIQEGEFKKMKKAK